MLCFQTGNSGIYPDCRIGLTSAKKLGISRILIFTNNIFLGTIIKNGQGEDYRDCFGFYSDLKGLIDSFEEVEIIVLNGGEQFKLISPMRLSLARAMC